MATMKRKDDHSTEFGLWLREQESIDSGLGYITSNLDYIWKNYNTGEWMLIEEKRYNTPIKLWQENLFKALDKILTGSKGYRGWHLLKFENTNPEDGKIWLDHKLVTKDELLIFLRME
jgi:hypothetical protein